jgi:hypothetical protein
MRIEPMRHRTRSDRWWWLLGVGYAVLMAAVVWSLFTARSWALVNMSTPESVAAWEAWRADVRASQDRPTPVKRRVPKSAEPPALMLMRDYFGVSLGGAIIFSSLLYWVTAWFIMGILSPAEGEPRHDAAAI